MGELQDWLKQQGLESLATVLVENDVDLDILPDLTEQDLERIGLSLGQRRRLLKAISGATAKPASPEPSKPDAIVAPASPREAERRQVTVMFCDLVGSTELSARLDPEDMSRLIRAYQDMCAGAIARFDGFLAKFMGDGILAYFGFPQAHEDSAERAVRAALTIVAAMPGLPTPDGRRLQTRIGIATGLVVVGDIIGSGVAREQTIVGETPNLAARLQGLASPDTILVSQSTQRLLGRVFDLESTGEHAIKGFTQKVPVWRVRGESAVSSRFAAVRAEGRVPFIGREHEMGLLLDRWRLATSGEGQFVLLTGEAGIGKSRLVEAFRERCGDQSLFIALQCSPHHENTALYPMVRYLELAAGFACEDTAQQKLEKLRSLLASAGGGDSPAAAACIHLLALLLSLPTAECPSEAGEAVAQMTPAQRRSATIALFVEHVIARARRRPVLVLLEDAHWIDPSTVDLVSQFVDTIQSEQVLFVVTARPDFASPWTGRTHAAQLTVSRLGRAQCAEMIAAVAAAHAIPNEVRDEIVAKTDGVPLFVEEVTKTILDSAGAERVAVPATLHDSLMARLDRLGDAKELAQIAAVIGRQFPEALLAAVAQLDRDKFDAALTRLVSGEIVFPQRQALETSYTFKHALMRDIAYDSLLRARRQVLHERIAHVLQERFPVAAENEPELLAYHYAAAGQPDAASRAHERAADRALARSAYAEAEAHLMAALEQTRKLPDHARRELALLLKLYPALTITKGIPASFVMETAQRAYEIADKAGDSPELFRATWNLWFTLNLTRRRDEAQARAEELVALGQRLNDDDLFLEAIHCRWSTALFRGDLAAALADSGEGMKRYDPARHHELGAAFGGHDPGVCAYSVYALALAAVSGERAREVMDQSIALAERLGHPHSLAHAYLNAMFMHQNLGDAATTAGLAQRLVEVAQKWNFAIPRTIAVFFQGWSTAVACDLAAGLSLMEAEFKPSFASGPMPNLFATMMADVYLRAGRPDEALKLADQTLQAMRGPDPGFYLPELVRIRERCVTTSANGTKPPELDGIIHRYEQRLAALKAAIAV